LQDGHNGPAMGFWSITDLTRTAPASTLRPVANWVRTIGPIILQRTKTIRQRERERDEPCKTVSKRGEKVRLISCDMCFLGGKFWCVLL